MNVTTGSDVMYEAALALKWTVHRIDIRSVVMPDDWPVVRVELDHPHRGRVTGIGTAPGAFEAIFIAASEILGISPRLLKFGIRPTSPSEGGAFPISVDIELEFDGRKFTGTTSGVDLVRCSIEAWLSAVAELAQ